ncbi:hypothetical protein ACFYO0_09375 [Streptomyces sp. NPDC006365]|uniref:hypothetical protein n=1 Tax=Streptomyces sp. NPDC006365 TaxID=3364744 RepID=UPI00368E984D
MATHRKLSVALASAALAVGFFASAGPAAASPADEPGSVRITGEPLADEPGSVRITDTPDNRDF